MFTTMATSSKAELPLPRLSARRSVRLPSILVSLCTFVALVTFSACGSYCWTRFGQETTKNVHRVPLNAQQILGECAALRAKPGPPDDFLARESSERFEPGTKPTLIRNATLWTGARNGTEIVYGDIYLDKGIVKAIGYVPPHLHKDGDDELVVDAKGAWVTPGIVDLHSHVGIFGAPYMRGTYALNSLHGPILPWLRSIDAFDTHDESLKLAIAGGVTTAQVLPGSANAIGGQAFMVKLRKTSDRSVTSMVLEPPHALNGSETSQPLRWRHLKQACGENLDRYGNRMDSVWSLRAAYNEARLIKNAQDLFCTKAEAGLWNELQGQTYPENLQWEAMVDVLRGRVKVASHCYEEVDIDDIVRLTNEFQFPIASLHHASEAWLVPEVVKHTWGGAPAVALFSTNYRYKRESYRGSEYAARVLADNGIQVVMKSDHPVTNERYIMYEAQLAHYYGLPPHLALASVTSVPAAAAGMDHRIGILHEGSDADVVLWDSHPLQLGATPQKVWIDGILQVGADEDNIIIGAGKEGREFRDVPKVPRWDVERAAAIQWEGLPPLESKQEAGRVVFRNVKEVWARSESGIEELFTGSEDNVTNVVIDSGKVSCVGRACWLDNAKASVDLRGGSLSPSFMTFGSPLGIEEITAEPSTGDGVVYNPLRGNVPNLLHDSGGMVRAVDALQFGTRNALIAHRVGVTYATTSLSKVDVFTGPTSMLAGLSVTFRTGSAHALQPNAIVKHITALHVIIGRPAPFAVGVDATSVSSQIAALRRLLLNGEDSSTETGYWFKKAARGEIRLVIEVSSADIMATLLQLKRQIENERGSFMKWVFVRATEAHLIADEIAKERVAVILIPPRPFPETWDDHRILAGPPLTNDTALSVLLDSGVTVAVGIHEAWQAANTRFDIAWIALESNGRIERRQAHAMASTALEKVLGVDGWIGEGGDLVAYEGGSAFDLSSKPVAIISPARQLVELL
ncbi:hypothetical protein B0H21DRAFT_731862 [Amylocystis lapponica]|nr:hypothetical protein B0H21DRAFT_731862 [Amylocystis lapponica]